MDKETLQRYFLNKLDEEDAIWVRDWLLDPENRDEVVRFMEALFEENVETGEHMAIPAFEEIWAHVNSGTEHGLRIEKKPNRKKWFWAAAASALLIVGSWFYLVQNKVGNGIAETAQVDSLTNDILPGGDRAVLTLADGSKVILDSTENGMISLQGAAQVLKQDGTLAYNSENKSGIPEVKYNSVSTPIGGQYRITLSDGTKVWLNSMSSIKFPTSFVGNEREVEISGEVYFEVAHNAAMPFRVTYNDVTVEVLGTHFDINAYKDESASLVTLLEGSVKVSSAENTVLLQPGKQAKVAAGRSIEVIDDVNLDEVMAWREGKFLFDRDNIDAVMQKLSRWYDMDYRIEGSIPNHFGGTISRDVPLSQVAEMLELTDVIKIDIKGKEVTVSPK